MEKQTRVNKYKDLRDEMKEEVAIDRQSIKTTEDADDDFLAFLPSQEKPDLDDTLIEPLSYETLNNDNEEVKSALNEAKVNVGKEQYNTRLDILNKIKQDEGEHVPSHEHISRTLPTQDVMNEEPHKKMSLLEKLAALSPEEDAEELKKFEDGLTVADLMNEQKKQKRMQKAEPVVEDTIEEAVERKHLHSQQAVIKEDNEDEEESKVVTILNYVIIVFIIIFIILAVFIVKQLLF